MLSNLYALQQVDLQLEEIEELKGDLPRIVGELTAQVEELAKRLKGLNGLIMQSKIDRDAADVEILALGEKIQKYKGQQLEVKSNKQYDALTREIDQAEARMHALEKEMEGFEGKMQTAKMDIESVNVKLQELTAELEEKQAELREVSREHETEELRLRHEREKVTARVKRPDLDRYERIRRAKGGKAVVAVKRNACGGCFNRIPPQKILELRQNAHLFMCEHCGRILVSDEIASMSVVG